MPHVVCPDDPLRSLRAQPQQTAEAWITPIAVDGQRPVMVVSGEAAEMAGEAPGWHEFGVSFSPDHKLCTPATPWTPDEDLLFEELVDEVPRVLKAFVLRPHHMDQALTDSEPPPQGQIRWQ